MSVRSFVQKGMHFGKLGERKSDTFGVIELYDIGETDTVGAFYPDRSLQAHSVAWYADLHLADVLAKHAKARATEEQQIQIVERPRIGQKPSLADDLRRMSHRDDKWVKPVIAKDPVATGANPGDAATPPGGRAPTARAPARAPRTPRAPEAVAIPKGADKQLKAWAEQHGACKAIRLLVHANPTMNRLSVVELGTQCGIHKTTAGVQYTNAHRDISAGRSEAEESKKAKGAANKQKQAKPKAAKPAAKPAKPAKAATVPLDPLGMLAGLKAAAKAAAKSKPAVKQQPKAKAKSKKK